ITIEHNFFSNNGLCLGFSNNNIIQANIISNCNQGINLGSSCENNVIYHNSLIDNNESAFDGGLNNWSNSSLEMGNYWSDYTGVDTDGDGIGDSPYNISGGTNQDMYPLMNPYGWEEDTNQSVFDRGFPIRHAVDGDWAGAQNIKSGIDVFSEVKLYLRKFGTPAFDLTVELRENGPDGMLLDSVTFLPGQVPGSWTWFTVDFIETPVENNTDYFIVCPPAPNGVTNSFGYEWGYAFGNQYDGGSFWFTRDGGSLWRDLPAMYEFSFRTYGYDL
ncbi:MAG: hypothetical protein KGY50_03730, partial [Candidatus Thermoplasmatota archaeon]|nr:hypothetical protein [Candidatus Thermoplasmatota archaeon]